MRHRNSGRGLSRSNSHRKAMLRNMAVSLFKSEVIKTTVAKANVTPIGLGITSGTGVVLVWGEIDEINYRRRCYKNIAIK